MSLKRDSLAGLVGVFAPVLGAVFGAVLGLTLVACAPTPMAPVHHATAGGEVLERVTAPQPTGERAVAVAVSEDGKTLIGWDLARGLLWKVPADVRSVPILAGQYVVLQEQDGVVVRDLATGAERSVIESDAELVGAAGYGSWVFVTWRSTSSGGLGGFGGTAGAPGEGVVAAIQAGKVEWRRALMGGVGHPAATNGTVIVPWNTQLVSMLDAVTGEERLRVRMRDAVIGVAFVDAGSVFVGQHGVFRVTDGIADATTGGSTYYRPLGRPVPAQPGFLHDGYEPRAKLESALHRIRFDWRMQVGAEGELALMHDSLFLHAFRLYFALGAEQDEVRWVFQGPDDIVGSLIEKDALYLADKAGTLTRLGLDGRPQATASLGQRVSAVTFRASDGAEPVQEQAGAGWAAAPASSPSLDEQLFAAASMDDSRLSSTRAFAATHLGKVRGQKVTGVLVDLCVDPSSPAPLRKAACSQVAERDKGGKFVLAALKRRASFVHNQPAPPLADLARAAARMKLRAAAPLLLAHISDPATSLDDLPAVFEALTQLKHRPARATIERFLRLHHADMPGESMEKALVAAAFAAHALDAKAAEPTLKSLADDGLAEIHVRTGMEMALRQTEAAKQAAKEAAKAKQVAAKAPAVVEDTRSDYLTLADIERVLKPQARKLRACVKQAEGEPERARVSMVINGNGAVDSVFVTPPSTQACVVPLITGQTFPETRKGRQQLTYQLSANAAAPAAKKKRPAKRTSKGKGKPGAGKPAKGTRQLKPLRDSEP